MSFPDGFPTINPFPVLGTFTIAGERRDRRRLSRSIPRLPIRRLIEEIQSYRQQFTPIWNNSGHAVLLYGPHGAGKTHSIYAALNADSELIEDEGPGGVFLLDVLHQDDNFLNFYRQIVGHVNKEPGLWKRLARSLLASMTAEQLSEDLGRLNPDPGMVSSLQTEPGKLDRTFDTYRVSRSGAMFRQEKAILDLIPSFLNKDLTAAIDALQSDKFDEVAARWLSLEPFTTEEQEAIGIAGTIDTPDAAVAAAQLLMALLTNSGHKLVVVMDQFEKLLVDTEPIIKRRNEGYLRTVIEGVRACNALLILSGSDRGRDSLSEDVKGRIGQRVIECPLLTLDEALDLIRLYLTPLQGKFTPGTGGIHPMTLPAVQEMLKLGAGNPRKLIQFSHEAMHHALASRTVIDEVLIRQIARNNAGEYFDRDSVLVEIRRALTFQSLRVIESFELGGENFDFAVIYADGSPALLISVSHAIFHEEEAKNAYRIASSQARIRQSGARVPVVLIVTGYVSPEVVENLRTVLQKLIIYVPDTFEREFFPLLDSVRRNATAVKAPPNREFEETIERVLSRMVDQRAHQSVVIDNRSTELLDSRVKRQERIENIRREWTKVRRETSEKMSIAKQMRVNDSLRQVNQQISLARNVWLARDFALTLLLAWQISYLPPEYHRYLNDYFDRGMSRLMFLCFQASLLCMDILIALTLTGAWSKVQRSQDLKRFGENTVVAFFGGVHRLNPIFRLVNYFSRSKDIPNEALSLIRSLAFREIPYEHLASRRFWNVPEVLVLVERGLTVQEDAPSEIVRASNFLRALKFERSPETFLEMLAYQIENHKLPWARIFDMGLDAVPPETVPTIGGRSLREALRQLSPFESSGLCTYDFLDCQDFLEEIFLFCSQLLFYTEGGMFDRDEADSAMAKS